MLTLLAPAALAGLSLLAMPIIVHLLRPRKVRRTPFSSLRWLHLSQQRLARRIRWHQVVLFLLRAAFIVLLVMALAKPILRRTGATAVSERFVVLDVSRSMGYRQGEQPTPLETGKRLAAAILSGGEPGDRTALLATSATTRVLGPLTHGAESYLPALSALEAGVRETDLGSALEVIRAMLGQRRPGARVDVYFITDHHLGSWRQGAVADFLREFPDNVRPVIIDVSHPAQQNGWIADGRLANDAPSGGRALEVQVRCVGGAQERTLRLTGLAGLEERAQTIALEPDRPAQVAFELPREYDTRGKAAELVLDPPDGLPGDDQWFVSLDGEASLRVLLVEGSRAGETLPPGFALRTAIESLSSPAQTIRLKSRKHNAVEPDDFRDIDAVLWADVPEMSDAALRTLEERVREGLGLTVFLGPGVVPEFYNGRLVHPLERGGGLLPARLDRIEAIPSTRGGLARLENVASNHPLLAGLFDPTIGDLARVQVGSYYRFIDLPAGTYTVLASVAGAPAIVEHSVGAGKVVLFNTTADDTWSDLPRRKSFVPLVDRLLHHLSGGAMQRTFQAGDPVALKVAPAQPGETISIVTPSGETLTPTLSPLGPRALLRLPNLAEPGVYRVRRSGSAEPETMFVVQVSRGDSVLAPFDPELLRSWWQPAELETWRADAAAARFANDAGELSLARWLVALACLVFATEMFLVHWLCPRTNPALSTSVVQRRSLSPPATPVETAS